MKCKWVLLLFAVNITYVLLGGVMFSFLEKGNEGSVATDANAAYLSFLENNTCVEPEELHALVQILVEAYGSGAVSGPNATAVENTVWSVTNAVFFALTCVTTIGYGYISPSTSGGQVFFIFYAIFGIPLMLVFLAQIGEHVRRLSKKGTNKIQCCKKQKMNICLQTMVLPLLGLLTFFFIPAAIFTSTEDWSFREGMYYTVTTLSTVGFGDYVAGMPTSVTPLTYVYRLMLMAWILVGLAWFAGVLALAQDAVAAGVEKAKEKISSSSDPEPAASEASLKKDVGDEKPADPGQDANGATLTAHSSRASLENA